jgi:excisionase family DNA binding protein
MSDRWLTPAELAAALRSSERTIARMVSEGCPSVLVGKRRRFELIAVTEWAGERAKCQSERIRPAGGTPRHVSAGAAFTDAFQKAHLRVMPSN